MALPTRSVFATSTPASPLAASLALALRTPPSPPRPVLNTFFAPSKTPIPPISSVISYTPPDRSTSTIPVASQTSTKGSIAGVFAQLARFSTPAPPPSRTLQVPLTAAPAWTDPYGPAVTTSPGHFIEQQSLRTTGSPISPFNPAPPDLGVATVGPTLFVGAAAYPPAPGPQPPVTPSASLPAAGSGGPGAGYPGEAGPMGGPSNPFDAGALVPMADLSKPNFQKLALYGAAGLGGLWLLSKAFKA